MAQTARVGTPSKVQNLVLYWPPYKAQLMLHSSIEANTCALGFCIKFIITIYL